MSLRRYFAQLQTVTMPRWKWWLGYAIQGSTYALLWHWRFYF